MRMTHRTYLQVENANSRIVTTDRELYKILHRKLRFRPKNYWHSELYKKKRWDGWKEFFNPKSGQFMTGLLPEVRGALKILKKPYTLIDHRKPINWLHNSIDENFLNTWLPDGFSPIALHDYQPDLVNRCIQYNRGIVKAPTACHRKGQKVVMYDGTLKNVENIEINDLLMGPDSFSRKVLSVHTGHGQLYKIQPNKGKSFVVNKDHVLTLIQTTSHKDRFASEKGGKLIDVTVCEWLKWSNWKKHIHKLIKTGVEFQNQYTGIDPYFIGLMLGDGSLQHVPAFHNIDESLIAIAKHEAKNNSLKFVTRRRHKSSLSHYFVGQKGKQNPLALKLKKIGLWNVKCGEKFIPEILLVANTEIRLEVLAGLIDTDGCLGLGSYIIVQKSERLSEDICRLALSLGLYASVSPVVKKSQNGTKGQYYSVYISGHINKIPSRLKPARVKELSKKDVLRTGFYVEPLQEEDFFGFTLNKDHRYLLDDFTITHNSGKTFILISLLKCLPPKTPTLFVTKNASLVHQNWQEMQKWSVENLGRWYGGHKEPNYVMCITSHVKSFESISKLLPKFKVLLVDEVHDCMSDIPIRAYKKMTGACVRIGFSATPFKWNKKKIDEVHKHTVKGNFGPIFKTTTTESGFLTTKELQERGILSKSKCTFYTIDQPDLSYEPYQDAVKLGIEQNFHFHKIVSDLAKSRTGRTLIVVERIEQGEYLKQLLPNAFWIQGKNSLKERVPVINSLKKGDSCIAIIMRPIITAGINIMIHDLINAAGGEGAHNVIQQMGRGLRTANDKEILQYHDFHFLINDYLKKHSEWRMDVLRKEGHDVQVVLS